ncbi:hypothetical protein MTO96_017626 [Rhipicephalus appendiculatus]
MDSTRYQMKGAIATLKIINRLLDTVRNRGETAITVITVPRPDLQWAYTTAEDFRELSFTPTLLISNGHYRIFRHYMHPDNFDAVCFILPPTRHPDDIPPPEVLRVYSFDVVCPGEGGSPESRVNYSADHYVMYGFFPSGDVVTYDNEEAFIQKLTAVKNLDPSVPFGLAVYDVDLDDSGNTCASVNKYGAFSRLKQLRKLLDSFNDNYGE